MKYNLIFLLIFTCTLGHTAIVIWPDSSAPCNGTLDACIYASNEGDTVEIHTNTIIDEDLFVDFTISIVAGNGYNPVFAAGNSLEIYSVSSGAARTVSIKGLTFEQGVISVATISRPIIVYIENNTVHDNLINTPAIQVFSAAPIESETIVHINYNNIKTDSFSSTLFPLNSIIVYKTGDGLGAISGELNNNTIHVKGTNSIGIRILSNLNDADISLDITGNEIYGGHIAGINSRRSLSSGTTDLNISSNAFYQEDQDIQSAGINIDSYTGSTHVDIINNTMLKGRYAIWLRENGGTITANIQSNLVAFNTKGFDYGSGSSSGADVINDYNLNYQNGGHINYTPGANAINADPKIIDFNNARLKSDSPALEAGNPLGLLLVAGVPLIDADGLHRIKNSSESGSGVIDIGAYEAGDVSFNHKHSATGTHVSVVDNLATNDLPGLDSLQITSNWNPDTFNGIYNNDNEGLFFGSNRWRVFNQDIQHIETGASFNIVKLASTANTFEHFVNSANANTSTINHSGLDGESSKILQVSQHYTGVYNPHPPGVIYALGHWNVVNLDSQNIPINSNFNVFYQDKSKSAYVHTAKDGNIQNNYTYLNNPLINGIQCAQIQVTQSVKSGIFNASPIGVFYDNSDRKWAIFNQDLSAMPENTSFHVLINPAQIAECSDVIFKNGFE